MQKEAALFKVLSDQTRLRLACLLLFNGETCVCRLAEALNEPDFKISRHLGVMRSAGMVRARRQGTWIYYRLVKPRSRLAQSLHDFLYEGMVNDRTLKKDLERLSKTSCGEPGRHAKKARRGEHDKGRGAPDDGHEG
ncbi:MAG TPA: metalloregulator ArsR/SmtB family transcription factor [Deltaproteobacteria bacterium]|nr:metalloregulator ArsR/SmtB family transcription factor [Deltaproteobacteria bacterium]HOM30191.1 metalloregulator ArsR/SmtB family transcription factor [Deltaproteobacteria bacterium]HPP81626.1 metalloregulator ArsR/SmtB family transcription factor [Deltaproteobacteria bacterium]